MRVLMCRPDHYDVEYLINPWMQLNNPIDRTLVQTQWEILHDTLQQCGAEVFTMRQPMGCPDLVFTANAALPLPNGMYLSHFYCAERQIERVYFKDWFINNGYPVLGDEASDYQENIYAGLFFEGQGDALWCGDRLIAGYGFRTQAVVYENMGLKPENIILMELVDPRFYHLDTCFCVLNESHALWWPPAFSAESQARIQSLGLTLFAVPEVEMLRFACNSVVLNDQVVMPTGSPVTMGVLNAWGFNVHLCDMSEFLKAGGACKCLTLIL